MLVGQKQTFPAHIVEEEIKELRKQLDTLDQAAAQGAPDEVPAGVPMIHLRRILRTLLHYRSALESIRDGEFTSDAVVAQAEEALKADQPAQAPSRILLPR